LIARLPDESGIPTVRLVLEGLLRLVAKLLVAKQIFATKRAI